MAQASITRTTRFFEAGASGHLPAGMVLDTDSSAFTLVRVDGKLGFIETGALSADGARSAGAGGAFAPAADSTATFARGAIDLREFRGAHFEGRLIADLDFHAHLEFLDRMAGQFGLTVILDPYKIFSIGIERVVGDDPSEDFAGPAFTRLALKVQLTRPQKRAINAIRARSPLRVAGPLPRHII